MGSASSAAVPLEIDLRLVWCRLALLEAHISSCGCVPTVREAVGELLEPSAAEALQVESPDLQTKSKRPRSADELADGSTPVARGGVSGLIGNTKMIELRCTAVQALAAKCVLQLFVGSPWLHSSRQGRVPEPRYHIAWVEG